MDVLLLKCKCELFFFCIDCFVLIIIVWIIFDFLIVKFGVVFLIILMIMLLICL